MVNASGLPFRLRETQVAIRVREDHDSEDHDSEDHDSEAPSSFRQPFLAIPLWAALPPPTVFDVHRMVPVPMMNASVLPLRLW